VLNSKNEDELCITGGKDWGSFDSKSVGDDRFKTKQLIEEMREWVMSFCKTVARNLYNQTFTQSKVNLIQCEKIHIHHTKHDMFCVAV